MRPPSSRAGALLALLAVVVALAAVGFALAQALRDTAPPALWIEAAERTVAGETFALAVSADEPARYTVRYGSETREAVEQDLALELVALEGEHELRIRAEDGAGNATEEVRLVTGVVLPRAHLDAPAEVRPGDPFTVAVRFEPATAPREAVTLLATGGVAMAAPQPGEDGVHAVAVVPLGTEPGPLRLETRWRDGLGRDRAATATLRVLPLGQPVEQLVIAASTLAVSNDANRLLEAERLASVAIDPAAPPLWTEPFLAPIEGRGTSGFGSPRRYAPGGPVSFHLGEDIAAPTGTPVLATNDGVVRLAEPLPIKGGFVLVDHGAGVTSRYFHLSAIHVEPGQRVARGETIGEVGSTGLSTGPHLHWEMWVGDTASYPMAWVDRVLP